MLCYVMDAIKQAMVTLIAVDSLTLSFDVNPPSSQFLTLYVFMCYTFYAQGILLVSHHPCKI